MALPGLADDQKGVAQIDTPERRLPMTGPPVGSNHGEHCGRPQNSGA